MSDNVRRTKMLDGIDGIRKKERKGCEDVGMHHPPSKIRSRRPKGRKERRERDKGFECILAL